MKKEIWKDVEGYEGYYQINKFGMIKSLKRTVPRQDSFRKVKERIMKPRLDNNGYPIISLSKKGITKLYNIHRLVGGAFIPNPNNKPEINHKNGIKVDVWAGNLEWSTRSENNRHAYRTGLKVAPWLGKFGKDNHRSKPVLQYDLQGNFIAEYGGQLEAKRKTGINNNNISVTCNGNQKTAGGFIWKFK